MPDTESKYMTLSLVNEFTSYVCTSKLSAEEMRCMTTPCVAQFFTGLKYLSCDSTDELKETTNCTQDLCIQTVLCPSALMYTAHVMSPCAEVTTSTYYS